MTIRCIAFDLDDTLWDCQQVIHRAEHIFYQWLAAYYPQITQRYDYHSLIQHRMAYMRQHPELAHNLTALRKSWLAYLADEANYDHELIDSAFHTFWVARNQVTLFDGVLDVLETLSSQYQLGVISNGNASVEQIGIGHFFDFTVSSEEAGVAKPHPDIFHLSVKKAGVDATQMVYVGDDHEKDIIGAGSLGIKTIWLRRNIEQELMNDDHMASSCIHNIRQLPEVIKAL